MRIALMQPYFFPYIGYYQLAHSVDEFIFYDDAAYIKQGYINRNRILLNSEPHTFSLAIHNASSFRPINEHHYLNNFGKLKKQLHAAYSKAPFFQEAMNLVVQILDDEDTSVSLKNALTLTKVFDYLELERTFTFSSSIKIEKEIRGQDRVIEICKKKSSASYINSSGGKALYSTADFTANGIELRFIETGNIRYDQKKPDFAPNLSMIDVLMWCDKGSIIKHLQNYTLTSNDH